MAQEAALRSDGRDYGIAAVERTFDVVAAMMHAGPSTLAAIADQAGCDRATTFRVLHTLQGLGLVTQDRPRGPWRMGPTWLSIGRAATRQEALEHAAMPAILALAKQCGEGVYLMVRDGQESQLLVVCTADDQVRRYGAAGDRFYLHAGPGRLLLAHAPAPIQRAVLARPLPKLGANTRTVPSAIAGELARISARGWLVTRDEIEDGAVTVSMPVRDSGGEPVAVLSIISPSLRMRDPRPHMLLTALMEAAGKVGAAIGVLP